MNTKVFVDDGSTSTKVAEIVDGEIKLATYSNRAEFGPGVTDDEEIHTYIVNDQQMTFYPLCDNIKTSNVLYQYSDHSVAAVHHALHLAGHSGKTIDLAVTLPISEFFEKGRTNQFNIERKRNNLKKSVIPEFGKAITIDKVAVYPEGIPAIQPLLIDENGNKCVEDEDIVFIADFGGTTLDLALFAAGKRIVRAESFPIGMFDIYPMIRQEINLPHARDGMVSKLLETGTSSRGRYNIDRLKVSRPTMTKAMNAVIDFLGKDKDAIQFSFLIGGGAQILSHHFEENGIKHQVVENPTQALVGAIANIELKKAS